MQLFFSWYLLLPVALFLLYGYAQYHATAALGGTARHARINWVATALSGAVLAVTWSVLGYPLPVFYVLAYLLRAARIVGKGPVHRKDRFLLNLSYINTMALHLAMIGVVALARGVTMHMLMDDGFWRTMSTVVVLAADFIENLIFLRWPNLPSIFAAEAESEEARPFMTFLWFCTIYLLVDTFLCVAELEPVYPPLFLVGSIIILMYFVIRFLVHISAIIRDEYLKDEHDRLSAQLEAIQENAGALKRIVDRDVLTGAFSRRYILGRIDDLAAAGEPFSLVFMDLDGLKQINDRDGHDAGDRYLIGFAKAVEVRLREGDLLARMGGDEFLLLMPGCDAAAAVRRMEGIRGMLETQSRGGTVFRFSYGVTASLPGEGRSAKTLVQEADQAMYRDKEQRR